MILGPSGQEVQVKYGLYWEHMAGSIVVQAALEQIGAPYEMHYVDMARGVHLEPKLLSINPTGRIPALSLPDGDHIGETAAILLLLGERHPESRIAPPPGDPDRAPFLFWLNVMSTSGYGTSSRVGHPERFARTDEAIKQVKDQADKDFEAFFDQMETAISGDPFFLPRGLTSLDHYLTMLAEWSADRGGLLADRPNLRALCEAVRQDPAYARALECHALPDD